MENYEKLGYLREPFRQFHLRDKGLKEVGLHYHDFHKMIVFLGGRVSYMIEGKTYFLEPGDVVFVPKEQIHQPKIEPGIPYERGIFYISAEYLQSLRKEDYDPEALFTQAKERQSYVMRRKEFPESGAGKLFQKLKLCRKEQGHGWRTEEELLFCLFMLELSRCCREEENRPGLYAAAVFHPKIAEVLDYINAHLFEELRNEELSERFYLSKYHLMRQFKQETGYTIHRYVTEKRIAAAKNKLLAGVPAASVSEECGFGDYSTFLRAFQSCQHMTPTAYIEARRSRWKDGGRNLL